MAAPRFKERLVKRVSDGRQYTATIVERECSLEGRDIVRDCLRRRRPRYVPGGPSGMQQFHDAIGRAVRSVGPTHRAVATREGCSEAVFH